MLFRTAPDDGRASADRVAALLPARTGGWVPAEDRQDDEPEGFAPGTPTPTAGVSGGRASGSANGAPRFSECLPASHVREPWIASPPGASGSPSASTASWSDDPLQRDPAEPDGETPRAAPRSWSDVGRHAGSGVAGRLRVLPSRSAVVALVLVAALAAAVAAGVVLRGRPQEVPVPVPAVEAAGVPLPAVPDGGSGPAAQGAAGPEVVVAVAGKVHRPGLVRLPAGSRVDDAVRAAGGPLAGASTGLLNLARRLADGEQVLVGVAPPPRTATAGAASGGASPLDLNAATVADLDALPGIGPVLAQRIVDWRNDNARFASVDQLREVTGIGEAKFADLRAKVTV